jgi:hypothetical protein
MVSKAFIVLLALPLLACAQSPMPSDMELKLWDQCGGKSGAPAGVVGVDGPWAGYKCGTGIGLSCCRQNEWYYQCLAECTVAPVASPAVTTTPSPAVTVTPSPAVTVTPSPAVTVTPSPAASTVVQLWGQCGGNGGTIPAGVTPATPVWAGYSCATGLTCCPQSEWYSQCLTGCTVTPPVVIPSPTPKPIDPVVPASPAPTTTNGPICAAGSCPKWAQCGGKGGDSAVRPAGPPVVDAEWGADYVCVAGTTCQRQSEWYYQCL